MSLAKNSLLYLVATLCIKSTSFFLLPLYTNLVPPEVYGQIYVVSALQTFLTIFLSISLQICISRFYFDCINFQEVKQLYSTILLFVFAVSTVAITPFFIFSHGVADFLNIPSNYLIYGLIMSYLGIYYQIIMSLLYAMQKAKQVSITSICVGIFQIVLQLMLVINMEDKAMALLSTMMAQAIASFIIFLIYSRPYVTFSFNFSQTNKYLKYSFSQFPSDVSGWFVNFTDRIFINKFIGHAGTGIYGIGANIGMIPGMIFFSMNSAFTPYVNSQYKAIEVAHTTVAENQLRTNLSRTFLVVSGILIIVNVFFVAFSRDIIHLLNKAYADAFFVVVVMLITSLMNSFRIMYMAPLAYNIKYTKVKSLVWVVAGLINIVLNYYLIPEYGIYAACLNSLITYTITFLLMLYFGKKAFYLKYQWGDLLKVTLISVLYASTLALDSSLLTIVIKALLFIPYAYICVKMILKIDIFHLAVDFVYSRIKKK